MIEYVNNIKSIFLLKYYLILSWCVIQKLITTVVTIYVNDIYLNRINYQMKPIFSAACDQLCIGRIM